MQHTLARSIECDGISLHKGENVTMVLHPADADYGIRFKRTDLAHSHSVYIDASYKHVCDTRLCTVLENPYGVRVSTVEHLMAALWGCGIDNALIEIDGPEVPVMDGSSEPFVFLIECAGVAAQHAPRRSIVIDAPIMVQEGDSAAVLQPSQESCFTLDVTIDFPHPSIGQQFVRFSDDDMSFRQSLSRARTFGFYKDVEMMRAMGLAQGGSLHNAVVLSDDGVMNEDGLRMDDECVRHKALDCIGDYYLSGAPIIGHVKTSRPGHSINNKLMKALFSQPHAWHYSNDDMLSVPAHLSPQSYMPAVALRA